MSSAIESRESPQPQTLDVGPFDLLLLHINPNKYQSTPSASRDTTARNSPSKFTTVESNPQTVGCISQCMGFFLQDNIFRCPHTPSPTHLALRALPPNTSQSQYQLPHRATPTSVTHRTLLKSPPISCIPQSTMLGISDKGKRLQHHWHHKFWTSRRSAYLSFASSHPPTSTPTSRPAPPSHQHFTAHPLRRRHARVQRVQPTHCCQPTAWKPCIHTSTPPSPTAIQIIHAIPVHALPKQVIRT